MSPEAPTNIPILITKTFGEVFEDGTLIELVANGDTTSLLLWDSKQATIAQQVRYGEKIFEAAPLNPCVRAAVLLPQKALPSPPTSELLDKISGVLIEHAIPAEVARLLSFFALFTWLADRFSTAPLLTLSAPSDVLGANALRLLRCFSRRPVLLTQVRADSFRQPLLDLAPTLLLNVPRLTTGISSLLRASVHRGFQLPGGHGVLRNLYGPKALFIGMEDSGVFAGGGGIHIILTPAAFMARVDDERLGRIAAEFQPLLLHYRLTHWHEVRESGDPSDFTFQTRQLVTSFVAATGNDPQLMLELKSLLAPHDEEVRAGLCTDFTVAIIEVILALHHEKASKEVAITEIAELVNDLLASRGGTQRLSPQEIGRKVKLLGFERHRTGSGQKLPLSERNGRKAHALARAFGLSWMKDGMQLCEQCEQCVEC